MMSREKNVMLPSIIFRLFVPRDHFIEMQFVVYDGLEPKLPIHPPPHLALTVQGGTKFYAQ